MSIPLDLQAMFASFKRSEDAPTNGHPASHPSDADPSATAHVNPTSGPPPFTFSSPLPRSNSASNSQGNPPQDMDRAQILLNLLNFGQPKNNSEQGNAGTGEHSKPTPAPKSVQSPAPNAPSLSASDLVASFMSSSLQAQQVEKKSQPAIQSNADQPAPPIDVDAAITSQDALSRFLSQSSLNRIGSLRSSGSGPGTSGEALPKGSQKDDSGTKPVASPQTPVKPANPVHRNESPVHIFEGPTATPPLEAQKQDAGSSRNENKPLYTYKNPFETLNASRNATPQPQAPPPPSVAPKVADENAAFIENNLPERKRSGEDSLRSSSSRRKLTPRSIRMSRQASADVEAPLPGTEPSAEIAVKEEQIDTKISTHETEVAVTAAEANLDRENSIKKSSGVEKDAKIEVTEDDNADVWESTDDSPTKERSTRVVPVYNFPIRPFVSITLKSGPASDVDVREDSVMEIARLKKEFDQADRSLAAATNKYICYALKNGGVRIIRQDDGSDRQIFKNSHDRVFHVALCTTAINTAPSDDQAVLGIGLSGSVYYAAISKQENDLFEKDALESESLIFPPYPLGDENAAGGLLKTRAKKSSRHPEFFAIGRGRSIHIIWPATAMSSKYAVTDISRKVDIEKLYKERTLKIVTEKAGKDFVFSEDDSVIASLDKAGKLRFWDIRSLVDEQNATALKVTPHEVDFPLMTLNTASPAEKLWPTSVLFIDKLRSYSKGTAQRYMLVGLKQNHTLQLWDVALGKAVQEVNFPHQTDTDGICSVSYHPNSGIIIVGHPTRNSIYFIHLSSPKYTLQPMSQASYIQRLFSKDPDIPKPDSTACMSGIREISFASKGQLRSVELLPVYKNADIVKKQTESIFELYVVHSRGVTCLTITKDDLGWDAESRVLHPVNAEDEGLITLKALQIGSVMDETSEKTASEDVSQSAKPKKKGKKAAQSLERTQSPSKQEIPKSPMPKTSEPSVTNGASQAAVTNGETHLAKDSKKAKKKGASSNNILPAERVNILDPTSPSLQKSQTPTQGVPDQDRQPNILSDTSAADASSVMAQTSPSASHENVSVKHESVKVGISGDWLDKELKKIKNGVSVEFQRELGKLYAHLQNDRNIQDSASAARQEAVLRLVSTTLSTNVEKSLSRIVITQMQQSVLPAISSVAAQAATSQIGDAIARVLHQLVPHELGALLPAAVNAAFANPQISRFISDSVTQKITTQIQAQFADLLRSTITPSFKGLAIAVAEKAASDVEARLGAQIRQLETDRRNDSVKIDKLSQVLQGMAETMQAMSDSQVAFQGQILKDRRQLVQMSELSLRESSGQAPAAPLAPSTISAPSPLVSDSNYEAELKEISALMEDGRYEEGSIKWLQSKHPVELFDNLFMRFTPDYLATDVSPLAAFSVAITVASSLATHTTRRLAWINTALSVVDPRDPEYVELTQHAPALLSSVIQKVEGLYAQTAQRNANDPTLNLIRGIVQQAENLRQSFTTSNARKSQLSSAYHYGQVDA